MITMLETRIKQARTEESAFTTAELLGNAALGVAALAGIWLVIKTRIAPEVYTYIEQQMGIGG